MQIKKKGNKSYGKNKTKKKKQNRYEEHFRNMQQI